MSLEIWFLVDLRWTILLHQDFKLYWCARLNECYTIEKGCFKWATDCEGNFEGDTCQICFLWIFKPFFFEVHVSSHMHVAMLQRTTFISRISCIIIVMPFVVFISCSLLVFVLHSARRPNIHTNCLSIILEFAYKVCRICWPYRITNKMNVMRDQMLTIFSSHVWQSLFFLPWLYFIAILLTTTIATTKWHVNFDYVLVWMWSYPWHEELPFRPP